MSRLTKIMVALLASTAIAAPAFAVTGDVSGFLHVRGVAADNMDGRDKEDGAFDDNTRAVDSRLRLFTTAALNENVKAVFTVEVDYVWGDNLVGKVGADQKGEIEIANLYLDFNIPEANTNVKAGTHYYKLGGGLILGEHASGVSTRTAFDENVNLGLYWVKAVEGFDDDATGPDGMGEDDNEDIDYYQAQLDIKAGAMTITPFVGYFDGDDNTARYRNDLTGTVEGDSLVYNYGIGRQYYYGLELKGKADAFEYGAVAFYNDGRYNIDITKVNNVSVPAGARVVEQESNDAFAFVANAAYSVGDTKMLGEVGRYGDSDSPTGEMVMIAGYNNFSEILTGGYFDVRSTAAGVDQTVASNRLGGVSTGNGSYYMNFQYAKLGVEQKLHEKGKLRAYYIYAEEAADNQTRFVRVNGRDKSLKRITFGHEIDAYYDYTVVPGLVMTVGGGYLLADDDFGYGFDANNKQLGGDDAWKAGLGLAYKF